MSVSVRWNRVDILRDYSLDVDPTVAGCSVGLVSDRDVTDGQVVLWSCLSVQCRFVVVVA
jgi:hypothetical protein